MLEGAILVGVASLSAAARLSVLVGQAVAAYFLDHLPLCVCVRARVSEREGTRERESE